MKKIARIGLVFFGILVVFSSAKINSEISINTIALEEKLQANDLRFGRVKDLIDFEYDTIYFFSPFQSKESMEEQIGFESFYLQESTSEDMSNILFVKDKEPVAYIYGRTIDDGYIIEVDYRETPLMIKKSEIDEMKYKMKIMREENPPYKKYSVILEN